MDLEEVTGDIVVVEEKVMVGTEVVVAFEEDYQEYLVENWEVEVKVVLMVVVKVVAEEVGEEMVERAVVEEE